jgi:hypothetical protein
MYKVENFDTIYCGYYDFFRKNVYCIKKIGSEKELIAFLASGFKKDNFYFTISNKYMSYDYWDGYNRKIEPRGYYEKAYVYWVNLLKDKPNKTVFNNFKRTYKGTFRRTSVEGIRKWRGGPAVKPRKSKHIKMMYDNPEYKGFNRRSKKEITSGWWDDWDRCIEKNWKSQRKHQWKEQ